MFFLIRRIKQFYTFSFQTINFLKLELNAEITRFDYMSQLNVFISFKKKKIYPFQGLKIMLAWLWQPKDVEVMCVSD